MEHEIEILKQNLILSKAFLYIIFVLISFSGISQDLYEHQLDEEKWSDIKENIRYEGKDHIGEEWTYENKEDYEKAKKNKGKGNGNGSGGEGSENRNNPSSNNNTTPPKSTSSSPSWNPNLSGLSWLGWLLMIVFGAALVALIVYLIMNSKGSSGAKKVTIDDYFEDMAPSEIPLTELQRRLKESLNSGDYRGAVRIYYLFILKDLSEKKWIFWEREKTNMHYLREMSGKVEFDDFNKSISYFEVIWYGKREIDQSQFNTIQPNFTNLLDKLGVK